MKKLFGLGVFCTLLVAATSCGEKKSTEAAAPTAEAVASTDTVRYTSGKGVYNFMEVRGYNAQGQLAVVDGYNVKDGGATALAEQTIYSGGEKAYAKSVDEAGKLAGEEFYTYADGRIKEILIKEFSAEKGKMLDKSKFVYTYDAAGNVTSIMESTCVNLHWGNTYEWTYTYGEQGRVADRKDYTYSPEKKQSRWETYAYDEQGRLAVYDYYMFDVRKGKQKHDSKTTYTYTDKGLLSKVVVERHKNTLKRESLKSREYMYDYNEAGQLTYFARQKYTASTNELANEFSTSNSYDELGRLVQQNNISLTRPRTESSYLAFSYSAEATAATPAEVTHTTSFFVPVKDGKPVVNTTDTNKSLTEIEED